nr:PREDICTED: trem-like transcript 4 protein [Equus przewalskii]
MPEEFHEVAGQTLSVQWQYPPEGGPYNRRTRCQQTSSHECT